MLKRILIVVVFVLVTIGIGFAIYTVFFKPAEAPAPVITNVNEAPPVGLPTAGERLTLEQLLEEEGAPTFVASRIADGGLTVAQAIAPVAARAPTVSPDGNGVRYYDQDTGKFYRTDLETGESALMSDRVFPSVETISWAPTEDQAILEFPDGSNILYNFAAQQQVTLPTHWEEFEFTSDSKKIIGKSIGIDPSNRWLMTSNPDGSGARPFQELGNNAHLVDVNVSPTGQVAAFSRTGNPIGFGRQEILLIGQKGENFKSLIVEGLNFESKWSPDGQRILYSASSQGDGFRPELWIVDGAGDSIGSNRRKLNLGTWADKCTFASATEVYCAVPRFLEQGVGLQKELADTVPDDIFLVDLATGRSRRVAQPDSQSTMENLMVTPDGRTLTFTEKGTNVLRKIRLAQ